MRQRQILFKRFAGDHLKNEVGSERVVIIEIFTSDENCSARSRDHGTPVASDEDRNARGWDGGVRGIERTDLTCDLAKQNRPSVAAWSTSQEIGDDGPGAEGGKVKGCKVAICKSGGLASGGDGSPIIHALPSTSTPHIIA